MSKKQLESDLCEQLDDVFDVCSIEQYQQVFLICVALLLHTHISPDNIEWDCMAEREKFEPADTN